MGLFDRRAEKILNRKENVVRERISLKDIKNFPPKLWLVFIICVAYYVTVTPFVGLATYVPYKCVHALDGFIMIVIGAAVGSYHSPSNTLSFTCSLFPPGCFLWISMD